MAEVKDKPTGLPSVNELDKFETDLLSVPPAYFSLGSTPQPMEDPPQIGDTITVLVRAKCTGTSDSVRTDGELRHGRKFTIQAAWLPGQAEPPDATAEQPALFGEDGEPEDDAEADDGR